MLSVKSIEKYGLKVGDTVDFVVYDVGLKNTVSAMTKIEGLDAGGAFEVVSHIHMNAEAEVMYQDLEGALVSATIQTVVATPQYDTWPVISVHGIRIKEKHFWKEGKDFTKSNKTADVIQLPEVLSPEKVIADADKSDDYVPPSKFCTCTGNSVVQCTAICRDCEKQETIETARQENILTDELIAENPYVQCSGGELRPLDEWSDLTKGGCSNCAVDLVDPDDTYWTKNAEPLCRDCVEDFNVMGIFNEANTKFH